VATTSRRLCGGLRRWAICLLVGSAASEGCTGQGTSPAAPYRSALYDVDLKPRGYVWKRTLIGKGPLAAYYARDPATNRTLYVGPDGIYYSFPHAQPITPADLRSSWKPHDVPPHVSVPKAAVLFAALGDSITYGLFASRLCSRGTRAIAVSQCRSGLAYADSLARDLPPPALYQNLAISGEFTSGVRRDEVALLDEAATLVLLNIGRNDEMPNDYGPVRFDLSRWRAEYSVTIAAIRERAPGASLVVANVPNYAYFPAYSGRTRAWRDRVTTVANAMNATINSLAAEGAVVVDLRCTRRLYAAAGFADVGHPNDLGHAWIATTVRSAMTNRRRPLSRCPPFSEPP
jgi:lysophospholipase L1-like esterase